MTARIVVKSSLNQPIMNLQDSVVQAEAPGEPAFYHHRVSVSVKLDIDYLPLYLYYYFAIR
jgi:hypothetical protein